MFSNDEQMAFRESKIREIEDAFKAAGVGTRRHHSEGMPYSTIAGFINLGFRGQRQAWVNIDDDGMCSVFLTGIYQVPEGKSCDGLELGSIPLLFPPIPTQTPNLGDTVVRRIREASIENSEMIDAKLAPEMQPPVPISDLPTIADLINAYERYYPTKQYHSALRAVLAKTGKVTYNGKVYGLFNGKVSHDEIAAGSKPPRDPNGEPIVYQNASHIRLAPLIAE